MISYRSYEKLIWTARIATVAAPGLSILYTLSIVIAVNIEPLTVPVGSFQGATIMLFPFLVAFAFIGWKWPLFGGLLVLAIGILIIFPIKSAEGWPGWYKIPYLICWVIYMAGGILYLVSIFIKK